jgi:hypothetical protein
MTAFNIHPGSGTGEGGGVIWTKKEEEAFVGLPPSKWKYGWVGSAYPHGLGRVKTRPWRGRRLSRTSGIYSGFICKRVTAITKQRVWNN